MPTISVACIAMALKAMIAMVAIGATGVAVVGFANEYNYGSAGTWFPSSILSQTVRFTADVNAGPCSTCLHTRFDNANNQHFWEHKPSPTLPLKISFAAPYLDKPTPTPPPTTRTIMSTPASFLTSRVVAPPHGASTLAASSMWYHNLFRFLADFVFARASSAPPIVIYKIIWLLSLVATPAYLIPRRNSFQETLGKVMAIILVSFHKPEMLLSRGTYKARTNRTPNLELRRSREVHADIPTASDEQYLFATADTGPSFGPSIQNAETEFRSLLERVEGSMSIRKQADIVAFFRKTLDSFTRALVVAEATPEGRNTRYMTLIQDQDRLIDELRMLHEYREQAFQENEDLVASLCQWTGEEKKFVEIPWGSELRPPFYKYSADYDKFIISPLESPAALSMKVSVQSAPFHRRPVTILDSDPHWQRFLESTAEKGSEQEARLASYEDHLSTCDEDEEDVKDGCMQEICDVPELSDTKYLNKHEDYLNKFAEKEVESIKDGCMLETCDVSQSSDDKYLDETEVGNDVGVNDAETLIEDLEQARSNLAWFEWQLARMKASYGISKGADSQQFSDIPPAITAKVSDDIAAVREIYEEDWARCPKYIAIRTCESMVSTTKVEIACMESKATLEGHTRN